MLSVILGIAVGSLFQIPAFFVYELVVLGLVWGALFFKDKVMLVLMVLLCALGFGIWYASARAEPKPWSTTQEQGLFQPLKTRVQDLINAYFSPPHSSILSAILLGEKQYMSEGLKQKLNQAGIRHITAISGMHIVILSQILVLVGIGLGLYRGQAFYFATALVWFFILFTGLQPSAIRAGILGTIFLFCQKLGRRRSLLRTLVLAGFIMLLVDPHLLKQSISFQLSFSASLGIAFLMLPIKKALTKIKGFTKFNIAELLALTFSAQIFTLPLLIYHFGYVSLVAPFTNLLVVPVLPFLMGLGLLFLVVSGLLPFLGLVAALPLYFLLFYVMGIVSFFAFIPFSTLALNTTWLFLPFYYGLLAGLVYYLYRKSRPAFLGY